MVEVDFGMTESFETVYMDHLGLCRAFGKGDRFEASSCRWLLNCCCWINPPRAGWGSLKRRKKGKAYLLSICTGTGSSATLFRQGQDWNAQRKLAFTGWNKCRQRRRMEERRLSLKVRNKKRLKTEECQILLQDEVQVFIV